MWTGKRFLALLLSFCLMAAALPALAESAESAEIESGETAANTFTDETGEVIDLSTAEVEGVAVEDDTRTVEADSLGDVASIEGKTPLYTTKIKPYVASGTAIRMRAQQDSESDIVCMISKGQTITIYEVNPTYVLAEYNGYVGYIIRTWIDENCTTIDPSSTPPYGVVLSQYVATIAEETHVYNRPAADATANEIVMVPGNKIAILEFVDGYAKVLYHRSYGYIDASKLTDLVVVSPTDEPLSADTPIAAFCSFFEYNTGREGNEGRCLNIVRSCELMTRVIQPGESLDFNAQIGPYKRANGYHPAPVLIDGGTQIGYGGGTCQSSSTLYNTVRQLQGVTVLMRRPHGPGCARYLPMHQDAAVGNTNLNLIFRNDYTFPIRIVAESLGTGTLCIQIFRED